MKTLAEAMRDAEAAYVRQTLEEHGGDVYKAATVAGVPPSSFYRLMRRHGVPTRHRYRKRSWANRVVLGVLNDLSFNEGT